MNRGVPDPSAAVGMVARQAHTIADRVSDSTAAVVSGLASSLPYPVTRLVRLLRQVIEEVPHLDAEVDVVVDEIRAQRLAIEALTAQLAALDSQLAVLESALAPLQGWVHRWREARSALVRMLERVDELTGSGPDS